MTGHLEVRLSPEQLSDLADLIVARLSLTPPAPVPLKLGYTIPEAAQVSSCKEWAIRTAITRGELPAKRNGRGAYVIHHAALDGWLRQA